MKKILFVIFVLFFATNLSGQTNEPNWGLARISVAHMRTKPGHSSELSSQVIMGMPIKLIEKKGDWWFCETPDGYNGYIIENSMSKMDSIQMNLWRESNRVVVTSIHETYIYKSPKSTSYMDIITDVVNGAILVGEKSTDKFTKVNLPDGRIGYINSNDITPIKKWASQEFKAELILKMAYSMMGLPYLWGGTSTKSLDCSGLAKVCYLANGIILRRDAYQQAETGNHIDASNWQTCEAGDLLFFGNKKTKRVTHVAIYNNNGLYIHASGRVKENSIDPESSIYLTTPFFHATRIKNAIGSDGIIQAINHPWYFNIKQ